VQTTRNSSQTDLLPSSVSGYAYNTFAVNVLPITPGIGLQIWKGSTNLFLASTSPLTQTITISATGSYTTWVNGAGSDTTSAGTATCTGYGAATNGSTNVINCTVVGTIIHTISGALNAAQFEAGTFGTPFIVTTVTSASRDDSFTTLIGAAATAIAQAAVTEYVRVGPTFQSGRMVGSQPSFSLELPGVEFPTNAGIFTGSTFFQATVGGGASFASSSLASVASWNASGTSIVSNGGTEVTNAATITADTTYYLGTINGSASPLSGPMARLTLWGSALPSATRISLSTQ
jgi:hypothetical protein